MTETAAGSMTIRRSPPERNNWSRGMNSPASATFGLGKPRCLTDAVVGGRVHGSSNQRHQPETMKRRHFPFKLLNSFG
jgi:hypothetical protein